MSVLCGDDADCFNAVSAIVNAAGPGSAANLQVDNFREQANAILKDNDVSPTGDLSFSTRSVLCFVLFCFCKCVYVFFSWFWCFSSYLLYFRCTSYFFFFFQRFLIVLSCFGFFSVMLSLFYSCIFFVVFARALSVFQFL